MNKRFLILVSASTLFLGCAPEPRQALMQYGCQPTSKDLSMRSTGTFAKFYTLGGDDPREAERKHIYLSRIAYFDCGDLWGAQFTPRDFVDGNPVAGHVVEAFVVKSTSELRTVYMEGIRIYPDILAQDQRTN